MSAHNVGERSAPQVHGAQTAPLDETTKASILAALAACTNCITGTEMGLAQPSGTNQDLSRNLAQLWEALNSATETLQSAGATLAALKPARSLSGPDSKMETRQPSRILIAEDSEDSRFLLQEFLKSAKFTLTFAENGKAAVETARERSFDLILMDIQMPVMDGLTATKLIREAELQAGLAPIPILALTANTRKADIELSLAAGCNAHILKPVSKPGLLESIQRHLPAAATSANLPSVDLPVNKSLLTADFAPRS